MNAFFEESKQQLPDKEHVQPEVEEEPKSEFELYSTWNNGIEQMCDDSHLVDTVEFERIGYFRDGTEFKHFILDNGLHVYKREGDTIISQGALDKNAHKMHMRISAKMVRLQSEGGRAIISYFPQSSSETNYTYLPVNDMDSRIQPIKEVYEVSPHKQTDIDEILHNTAIICEDEKTKQMYLNTVDFIRKIAGTTLAGYDKKIHKLEKDETARETVDYIERYEPLIAPQIEHRRLFERIRTLCVSEEGTTLDNRLHIRRDTDGSYLITNEENGPANSPTIPTIRISRSSMKIMPNPFISGSLYLLNDVNDNPQSHVLLLLPEPSVEHRDRSLSLHQMENVLSCAIFDAKSVHVKARYEATLALLQKSIELIREPEQLKKEDTQVTENIDELPIEDVIARLQEIQDDNNKKDARLRALLYDEIKRQKELDKGIKTANSLRRK